jgi:trehalose 6-phosphate synthase
MTEGPARERRRLLVASNRGPVGFRVADGGNLVSSRGGGGLVTALGGLARHHDLTWVCHALGDGDVEASRQAGDAAFDEMSRDGARYRLRFVGAPDATYELYYNTISNPLLWFLHHRLYGFGETPTIDRGTYAAWRAYEQVNRRVAEAIDAEATQMCASDAEDDDDPPVVIVHDYQLFLVPGMVRERQPDLFLQFFLHIPFPGFGAWRALPRPWCRQVCESLLACEIVGFQTRRDVSNFLRTCEQLLGAEVDYDSQRVRYLGATTQARAYPISVAVDEFRDHVQSPTVERYRDRIRAMRPEGGKLIVRVDRTDPSKNIVRGYRAYELLLHEHPELHGEVAMFCQLDPSRQDVPEYSRYLERIQATAERLNATFGTSTWTPLHVNLDSNFLAGVAGYCEYDVLYVNPVADGMNLVSKEGPLVNERDGVVVLSDQAGSFNELGPYVTAINPFDVAQQADALYAALTMDTEQRVARAQMLRQQVQVYDVRRWMDDQLDEIERITEGAPLPLQ